MVGNRMTKRFQVVVQVGNFYLVGNRMTNSKRFQVVVQVGEQVTCRLLLTEGGRPMTGKPSIAATSATAHKSSQEVVPLMHKSFPPNYQS